ncbi:MAG: DUF1214 domain-containing protein, partial [Pseudomonadota bacterium]
MNNWSLSVSQESRKVWRATLKYLILGIGAIIVIAVSFFTARAVTLNSLTNQNSIFDSFETVEGPWLYSDRIGAAAASEVERARVAIGGPLGLSSKEAVYFVATQDDAGEPLRSQCTYRVTGQPIDTRWWSLTLYDRETQHYVPNIQNRSSWNSISIPRNDRGDWVINISPTPQDGAWLPSQETPEKAFELNLRVYNPSEAARAILPDIELPTVERV